MITLIDQLNQRKVGGSGFAWGNEIDGKLITILEKVAIVSLTVQMSSGVLLNLLLVLEERSDLEESSGVEYKEEDITPELGERPPILPRNCARLIHVRTQQQLAN